VGKTKHNVQNLITALNEITWLHHNCLRHTDFTKRLKKIP